MIPQEVYQFAALATSIMLTFHPETIWASEALYLSIFGVIANVIILGWIADTYEEIVERIIRLISLNVPISIVVSAYATLYFGGFAIYIDSWFLGIIASIAFVGMFTFTMETSGICTFIGFDKEDLIVPGMLVSLLILVIYSFVTITNIPVPYLDVFSVGIEYVITIMLTISLVILTSFFFKKEAIFGLSILLFILTFLGANAGMILFGLNVIPAIVNTGFVLFFMGWLHYFTYQLSGILTMFVAAVTLYGTALLIEANPQYFVTALF